MHLPNQGADHERRRRQHEECGNENSGPDVTASTHWGRSSIGSKAFAAVPRRHSLGERFTDLDARSLPTGCRHVGQQHVFAPHAREEKDLTPRLTVGDWASRPVIHESREAHNIAATPTFRHGCTWERWPML
jgi:hypothetical protein